MIEARGLSKRYGDKVAVDDLSFTVRPGLVTGFLGPNGAGKSTTLRMIVGLDQPTSGTATVCGRPYRELARPLCTAGALLEAKAVHSGRTAREHLRGLAASNRLPKLRVDEVLEQVGLTATARRRVGGFSLGMGQRLGIAAALLGDPEVIILDEPVNGLDPEGIQWVREFMRGMADEGRTVLVSSHLMSEMQDTADHLIVIGRGRLAADSSMADFLARSSHNGVVVRSPHTARLVPVLRGDGATVDALVDRDRAGEQDRAEDPPLIVKGLDARRIGELAGQNGLWLHELAPQRVSLQEAFMELTADAVEYRVGQRRTAEHIGGAA
ncbi:ABC transporter ATP-binding protein [Streptomyces cucumeris]|uniref:ABC transporter ATP-binding protein n=1 Tax=Streptomyces cucumeris TaxID=2962890 RepID=UPI003EB72EE2